MYSPCVLTECVALNTWSLSTLADSKRFSVRNHVLRSWYRPHLPPLQTPLANPRGQPFYIRQLARSSGATLSTLNLNSGKYFTYIFWLIIKAMARNIHMGNLQVNTGMGLPVFSTSVNINFLAESVCNGISSEHCLPLLRGWRDGSSTL